MDCNMYTAVHRLYAYVHYLCNLLKNMINMKRLIILILFIFPFLLNAQDTVEINAFIDQWHRDAANVDREAYFGKIDDKGIYIGTDASEIWTKQEFYDWAEPQFTGDGKAWDFKAVDRNIYVEDDPGFIWFDELLSYTGGTLRGSGVLIRREDGWKILHYVLSLPVPNDKFRAVLKAMNEE